MRSWLFVPGDSERKLAKVDGCGADAVILDLEDSVALQAKAAARDCTVKFLGSADRAALPSLWVRVNPHGSEFYDADVTAVAALRPDGIVLPKAHRADLASLDERLTALEAEHGFAPNSVRVLAIATETPAAVLELAAPAAFPARVSALTWGAEDLAAELGASSNLGPDGRLAATYQLARSLCQLAAVSAGLAPVDGVYTDFRDSEGLAGFARQGCREGFTGMLAIHPAQVAVINEAFTPSDEEIARARAILAAFDEADGVASLDGQMLDRPHQRQAERVLQRARGSGTLPR